MQTHFSELSDAQWQVIEKILNDNRLRRYSLRSITNAILWVLRSGVQWRNLLGYPFSWQLAYYYFRKWRRDGTLERLSLSLNQLERLRQGKSSTPSLVCIDSQSVKSAPFVQQDKGIDAHKRVNGRKRHLLVDTLGLVWAVVVHAASEQDGTQAHLLVEHCLGYLDRMKKILVDAAYQKGFYDWVYEHFLDLEVEVSSRPPTQKGFVPLAWRWVNERTFGWTNFFRRLSKDYEKSAESAEAWVLWMNCQIILSRIE